jgi:two-component system LytT family response regulator
VTALRTLIVDDERFARQRLRRLLEREDDVEVVGECESGREAVEAIERERPDLVLLDVQMPALDGFGVLRSLDPERMPLVVFVTAFDEHALRAFDVHALDYLLKPVDPDRFRVALGRAKSQHGQASVADRHARLLALLGATAAVADGAEDAPAPAPEMPDAWGSARAPLERLLLKHEGRMYFVKAEDIDWIEAYGNYARLHVGPRTHLLRETMSHLESRLDPARFARIHRSTIVNLDRVKEMEAWFSGEYIVRLADGTQLKLSRWYRDRLERRMRTRG